MPPTVDHREEQQLLDAAKTATDLVASGMTPDAAVEKVARDNGFGPGKIRLIGQAYNTGHQLGQWHSGGTDILAKLASYDLCDPDKVINSIYNGPTPAEKKAAETVSHEYLTGPHWLQRQEREKTASVKLPVTPKPEPYAPDPNEAVNKAYGNIQRYKQASDEARRQAAAMADTVRSSVAKLVGYLKQASHARLPFEVIESAARSYYGDPAVLLLDMAYTSAHLKEKRAGDKPPVLKAPLNQRAEPFTLIKQALDAAVTCHKMKTVATNLLEKAAAAKTEQLLPFAKAGEAPQPAETGPWTKEAAALFGNEKKAFGFGTEVAAIALGDIAAHKATHLPQQEEDPYGDVSGLDDELNAVRQQAHAKPRVVPVTMPKTAAEKKGFLGVGIGSAIGSSLGRSVGSSMPKSKDDLVNDDWMGLEDPEHENELRKIKAHAMINQLMTDPDDPISGHDPDKVLSAYNEISQGTPRLAANIGTLRPALRKHLEGHQEPFEAKELLDIEHGLARTKAPTPSTNILGGDAPEKMLG